MPAPIRLQVRLSAATKETIECAAAVLRVSANEFIVSAVAREAQQVLDESQITRLSNRDRDNFLKMLDDVERQPNSALVAAANRYKSLRRLSCPSPITYQLFGASPIPARSVWGGP